jgi:hypothetical protein
MPPSSLKSGAAGPVERPEPRTPASGQIWRFLKMVATKENAMKKRVNLYNWSD